MALSLNDLSFLKEPYPKDAKKAAARLAEVYDTYAKKAMAAGAAPVFTGLERQQMEQALLPVLAVPNPTPSIFAVALALGIQKYWFAPPVAFAGGGIITGIITVAAPAAIVVPALQSQLFRGIALKQANQNIATAVDAATKAIVATLTYPGSPPVVTPTPIA